MNHAEDVLVPLFAMMFLFGAPVAAFIVSRVLKHQERIEMIRHGIMPGADVPPSAAGAAPPWTVPKGTAAPAPPPYAMSYIEFSAAQAQLRKGLMTALIGFAILIGLFFIDVNHLGPWLLGGLIPMFVGIAQIIVAILSGARFGPPVQPYQQMPGRPSPEMSTPRDVTPGNSYAYRPGSTVELEPPASPPDRR